MNFPFKNEFWKCSEFIWYLIPQFCSNSWKWFSFNFKFWFFNIKVVGNWRSRIIWMNFCGRDEQILQLWRNNIIIYIMHLGKIFARRNKGNGVITPVSETYETKSTFLEDQKLNSQHTSANWQTRPFYSSMGNALGTKGLKLTADC